MQFLECRFVIKRVDVTDRSRAIDDQYLFGWHLEVSLTRVVRLTRIHVRADRGLATGGEWFIGKQFVIVQ